MDEADKAVSRLWWLWLAAGIAWIVIALIILQFDQASVTTVGVLVGLMFILSGFQQFVFGSLAGGWLRVVMWLFAVLFLAPFGDTPRLEEIAVTRDEIARLQPVSSSRVNAPTGRRLVELARMLASSRVFRLWPGDPDETAAVIEQTIRALPLRPPSS